MSLQNRKISYSLAINEALHQAMQKDEGVFLIGQGVKSPWYVGNTTKDLLKRFGAARIIDTPVSENAITGAAVGAAIAGMRAVVVHPRIDFMMYAMDPVINEAANWRYMYGGKFSVPVVIWGIVNRGGEQAAQHSQVLHNIFAHIPGLKVVAPSTPYDAKGLMLSAIYDGNPVFFMDERWLYNSTGPVPKKFYTVPIGKGIVRRKGTQVTVATFSYLVHQAMRAASILEKEHISLEIIDLRTIKPLDGNLLLNSVKKTGKLLVIDSGWKTSGFSAEVAALASENVFKRLKAPVVRMSLPDVPAPASRTLETVYYHKVEDICRKVRQLVKE